jgi:hypothetical protein
METTSTEHRGWHRLNRPGRRAVTTLLVSLAASAATVVAAPAASASPSNCGYGIDSIGQVHAWCATGSGSVRAVAGCEWFGWWTEAYGPWVNIQSGESKVSCPWPYGVRWGGFNISG